MITLGVLGDLPGIRHGFMTRAGGVSEGIYDSLNCGLGSDDNLDHVRENRRLYREKFAAFHDLVNPVLPLTMPDAAFYFWADVRGDDEAFARDLFTQAHIMVLPGSYLSRDAHGTNPGRGFVRIALVSTVEDAIESGKRIAQFVRARQPAAVATRG